MDMNTRNKERYVETHTDRSNQAYNTGDRRFSSRVVSVQLQRSYTHYQSTGAAFVGIVQVLLGILSISLGISQPLVFTAFGESGFGIWCGVVFVVAGLLGIITHKKKTPGWIISHMVFSIMAATFAALMFTLAVAAIVLDNRSYLSKTPRPNLANKTQATGSAIAVDVLLALTAFFEGIAAIVASSISCRVTCCNNNFQASQTEVDNPIVLSYHVTDSKKYVVNPSKN